LRSQKNTPLNLISSHSQTNQQLVALSSLPLKHVNFRVDLNDLNNINVKSELKLINSLLNSNTNVNGMIKRCNSLVNHLCGDDLNKLKRPGLEHHHFNSKIGRRYSLNLGKFKRPEPVISIYEPSLTLDPIEI
jgi:hypothetical protein